MGAPGRSGRAPDGGSTGVPAMGAPGRLDRPKGTFAQNDPGATAHPRARTARGPGPAATGRARTHHRPRLRPRAPPVPEVLLPVGAPLLQRAASQGPSGRATRGSDAG